MYEQRDYFLLMLKQVQLERLQDMTLEEQNTLNDFEKYIQKNLDDSNLQISNFLKHNHLHTKDR